MKSLKHIASAVAAATTIALLFSLQASGLEGKSDSNTAKQATPAASQGGLQTAVATRSERAAVPSLAECERAARGGDPNSEAQLGFMYQTGMGVEPSAEKALHWYQLASASGQTGAKVNMAVMYFRGVGVTKDEAFATELMRQAAEKGNGRAASYLGDMYFFGRGVSQDRGEAERWYARGAKMHDSIAEYNLGLLNTGEFGHRRDLDKAISLLKKSADAGYVPAIHALGLLYVREPHLGNGAAAPRLLESASEAGYWRSTVTLGLLYRDGKFVDHDADRAYYYFRLAALQGGETARKLVANDLKALDQKLPQNDTASMSAQAATFYAGHSAVLPFVAGKEPTWAIYMGSIVADGMEQSRAPRAAQFPPA